MKIEKKIKNVHANTDNSEEQQSNKHADDEEKKDFNFIYHFSNIIILNFHPVTSLLVSPQLKAHPTLYCRWMVSLLISPLVWSDL